MYIVEKISTSLYKEKGSRFIGILCPIQSKVDIQDLLKKYKKEYFDARHLCYAYIYEGEQKAFDDGEPAYSAGAPILRQLQSFELINTLAIVVRYFGGTKLGVSGLIQAYGTTVKMAIEANQLKNFIELIELQFTFNYSSSNRIKKTISDGNYKIMEAEYSEKCLYKILVPKSEKDQFLNSLSEYINII